MVSVLDSGVSDPDLSPGQGHCVVFLARHFTLPVPLSTQVYKWVPANCWGNLTNCGGNDLRCTNIPPRGSRKTSSHFHATETGKSSGSYGPVLASRLHFF